jgi:hypothetical protein
MPEGLICQVHVALEFGKIKTERLRGEKDLPEAITSAPSGNFFSYCPPEG